MLSILPWIKVIATADSACLGHRVQLKLLPQEIFILNLVVTCYHLTFLIYFKISAKLLCCCHANTRQLQLGRHCSHTEMNCKRVNMQNRSLTLKDRKDFDIITNCCESQRQGVARCSSSWIACLLFKTFFQKFLLFFSCKTSAQRSLRIHETIELYTPDPDL